MTAAQSSESTAATSIVWDDAELVMNRVYPAPRALVFRAWTEAEHFAQWFGPHGTTLPHCVLDARPGGSLHFLHRHANGDDVWIGGRFHEVAPPDRLSFGTWFSDATGAPVERPGFGLESTITVTFAEHADGTQVTIRQTGLIADQGEVEGWTETLDRLAAHLGES
jgi:uncharacterized protein YndB with AHSA1/START domain